MALYANVVHIGSGSIRTIHNDLENVIIPALSDYNVEVTIHSNDHGRVAPGLPGIYYAWASNLRSSALDGRAEHLVQGCGHTNPNTVHMIGPQAWNDRPAYRLTMDKEPRICMREGLVYNHFPMAINREELPKMKTAKKGMLYFASMDTHKSFMMNHLVDKVPDLKVLYADYSRDRRELLEYVSQFEFVFAAGYCAVEALALGCKVLWTARRFYGHINEMNLQWIKGVGYTWDNRVENLPDEVKAITIGNIHAAMDECEVIEDVEQFHVQDQIAAWQCIAADSIAMCR